MIDLHVFRDEIRPPDADAKREAEQRQRQLTKPLGALGRLEDLGLWLSAAQGTCPPRPLSRARVVIFAADHGVARHGVSAYPPEVTAQMVSNFVRGGAAVNALARTLHADVRVLDMGVAGNLTDLPDEVSRHKICDGTGDITVEDAITVEQSERALLAGMAVADEEIDAGVDLLIPGDMGIGNTTPAAALIGLLANQDAAAVTGRGTGIDDEVWMRKAVAVRDAMRRGRGGLGRQIELLAKIGGPDFAAMTGFLLQSARRRTPVILDGVVSGAAAMLAHRIAYRSARWFLAGHRSVEPAHEFVLNRLQLEPLLDYRLRLGEGTGALLALPMLRAAQATLTDMATFDEAGVTTADQPAEPSPPEPDEPGPVS